MAEFVVMMVDAYAYTSSLRDGHMVRLGIENLMQRELDSLAGERIGLITNPSGVDSNLTPAIDLLHGAEDVDLRQLFGPEHGIRGSKQAGVKVEDRIDERTGLPVKSLYGDDRRLQPASVAELDTVVYDLQDIGSRFYTLIYTLAYALQGTAETNTRIMVLDRPNPIAPLSVRGNRIDDDAESFVGGYGLPIIHGLTVGELARYFNTEYGIGADLDIVELSGWSREEWYDETELPWIHPSPNMPTLTTATIYPGTCFFEGTTLSEGRGTTKPFELVGAPWIDAEQWSASLNELDLDGVGFRPAYFTPMFSKHERKDIEGVHVHVLDRDVVDPVAVGITMLASAFITYPDSDWLTIDGDYFVDKLAGGDRLRKEIDAAGPDIDPHELFCDVRDDWERDEAGFSETRSRYLLYDTD
jgi:beta-N-acetylhexosaminidase